MEIIGIRDVRDLASDLFTVSQRGLLITIFILREEQSKLTLAKFKTQVKIYEHLDDLIDLHERKIIVWSGYKQAVKKKETSEDNIEAMEAIEFLNNLYGTGHAYNSKGHYSSLCARLKEHGLETVKAVIANRYAIWKDDSFMSRYLRPSTVFNATKFSIYLEETKRTKIGESFLNVAKIGLNDGDLITVEIAETFIDDEIYDVYNWRVNTKGERQGFSRLENLLGKDIKKNLKIQRTFGEKDFEYTFKKK